MYFTANKYYCPKCRTSFLISDRSQVAREYELHCPYCGLKTSKFTSAFWFVEKK